MAMSQALIYFQSQTNDFDEQDEDTLNKNKPGDGKAVSTRQNIVQSEDRSIGLGLEDF